MEVSGQFQALVALFQKKWPLLVVGHKAGKFQEKILNLGRKESPCS